MMDMANNSPGAGTMDGTGKKIILGFSGGLDTSFCAKYLHEDRGFEVHSIIVNTGGFDQEELKAIEAHAFKLGVKTHTAIDAVESYYDRIIRYLIYGNVLKNNTYPAQRKCRKAGSGPAHCRTCPPPPGRCCSPRIYRRR
jgi:argininosuccinate synthase